MFLMGQKDLMFFLLISVDHSLFHISPHMTKILPDGSNIYVKCSQGNTFHIPSHTNYFLICCHILLGQSEKQMFESHFLKFRNMTYMVL